MADVLSKAADGFKHIAVIAGQSTAPGADHKELLSFISRIALAHEREIRDFQKLMKQGANDNGRDHHD